MFLQLNLNIKTFFQDKQLKLKFNYSKFILMKLLNSSLRLYTIIYVGVINKYLIIN